MASLTTTAMREITRLQRQDGIAHLSAHFPWEQFGGDEVKRAIHQELVYDSTMFAWRKGFSWTALVQVASMAHQLFPQLKGLQVPEVFDLIKERVSTCVPGLPPPHSAALCTYLLEGYIPHQHLYQAVLHNKRNLTLREAHVEIHIPPVPPPLSQGTERKMWEYQQTMETLRAAEKLKQAEILKVREEAHRLVKERQKVLDELPIPENAHLDLKEVEDLVRSGVHAQAAPLLDVLRKEAELTFEVSDLQLQQINLSLSMESSRKASLSSQALKNVKPPSTRKKK